MHCQNFLLVEDRVFKKLAIVGVMSLGLLCGCDRTESDWKQAKDSNTVPAYTDFLAKHPQSLHVDEARGSIDELDWIDAKTKNTFDAYNGYVARHADGKHLADVRAGIEALPLKLSVAAVAVGSRFQAYVGGGSNISPPTPIDFGGGSGGGIPLISISSGSAFLAGEVHSQDEKTSLIRIECQVENPTDKSESFKIGDLMLAIEGSGTSDFIAVGHDDRLCAMSDADRRTVSEMSVELAPKAQTTLSYVFALTNLAAKQGKLVMQNAAPISFQISTDSTK
jgi:hypothetical protein